MGAAWGHNQWAVCGPLSCTIHCSKWMQGKRSTRPDMGRGQCSASWHLSKDCPAAAGAADQRPDLRPDLSRYQGRSAAPKTWLQLLHDVQQNTAAAER